MKLKFLFSLVFLALFLQGVSAHFVCGEVLSEDITSPSWMTVDMSYLDEPTRSTSCVVSPQDGKYCCDAQTITGREWQAGDVFLLTLLESERGYVSIPVSVSTTQEGFDIAPPLLLERAFTLENFSRVLFDEEAPFFVRLGGPLSEVSLLSSQGTSLLCSNCSSSLVSYPEGEGSVSFSLSSGDEASQNYSFVRLSSLAFSRDISCSGCRGKKLRGNQEVVVTVRLNLSHAVTDSFLLERIPSSWELLGASVSPVYEGEGSYVLPFVVNGSVATFSYTLRTPDPGFVSDEYLFSAALEDYSLGEEDYIVWKVLPYFSSSSSSSSLASSSSLMDTLVVRVSPTEPLVFSPANLSLSRVVLFPTTSLSEVALRVTEEESSRGYDYFLYSSAPLSSFDRVRYEFPLTHPLSSESPVLFSEDYGLLVELVLQENSFGEEFFVAELPPSSQVSLLPAPSYTFPYSLRELF